MTCLRGVITRASPVRHRYYPFAAHSQCDDHQKHDSVADLRKQRGASDDCQRRSFAGGFHNEAVFGVFQNRRCLEFSASSFMSSSLRHLSSAIDSGPDHFEADVISNVTGVLSDTTLDSVAAEASAVSEVAIAAADSFFPVAALQYFIDGVHCFTGLNWWASIVVTTFLIRGGTIPLLINQLQATSKLALLKPHLEKIREQVQDKGMDPMAVDEGQKQIQKLFKEYGVSAFTPFKGILIQGPIFFSFFMAITRMAEKMPSFKSGGSFWFSDITAPDSLFIFPVATAAIFLLNVELNTQDGMEGNSLASNLKNIFRVLAVVSIPLTMNFPTAIFCYWLPSNIFSMTVGLVLKNPAVKKSLGIPEIPLDPPSSTPTKPSFSNLFKKLKQAMNSMQTRASVPPANSSSALVCSQRLKSLEKQIKGRKRSNR